jgi:Tfp pilus assembly protein PilO
MSGADLGAYVKKHPGAVACLVVILACLGRLYFCWDRVEEGKTTYEAKTREDQQIQTNLRNSTGLSQQVEVISQASKQIEDRLVHVGELAKNLRYFYQLENESGAKLLDVHQNSPGRQGKTLYVGIPFTVTVQGSFKSVMDFIRRLENGRNFARFNTLSFSKVTVAATQGDAGADVLNVAMSIELLGINQ